MPGRDRGAGVLGGDSAATTRIERPRRYAITATGCQGGDDVEVPGSSAAHPTRRTSRVPGTHASAPSVGMIQSEASDQPESATPASDSAADPIISGGTSSKPGVVAAIPSMGMEPIVPARTGSTHAWAAMVAPTASRTPAGMSHPHRAPGGGAMHAAIHGAIQTSPDAPRKLNCQPTSSSAPGSIIARATAPHSNVPATAARRSVILATRPI